MPVSSHTGYNETKHNSSYRRKVIDLQIFNNRQAMRTLQTPLPAQHQAGCPRCLPAAHRLGMGHRHPSQSRKQCLVGAAAEGSANFTNEATVRPKSAETARTIVEVVSHGTLSTVGEDGTPLGTYSSFVLDSAGMPILRLRRDAVHTANLKAQPRCSLFVQPGDRPAKLLARATLIGRVEEVDEATAADAAKRHLELHPFGVGVDEPRDSDLYLRLKAETCFYVGGMGGNSQAEVLPAAEYSAAQPDPLREAAPLLVDQMNTQRAEDVLRIAACASGVTINQMEHAQALWVDRLGLYIYSKVLRQTGGVVRVPFLRPVLDERDARSTLTMLGQTAWEEERQYKPIMLNLPEPAGVS